MLGNLEKSGAPGGEGVRGTGDEALQSLGCCRAGSELDHRGSTLCPLPSPVTASLSVLRTRMGKESVLDFWG